MTDSEELRNMKKRLKNIEIRILQLDKLKTITPQTPESLYVLEQIENELKSLKTEKENLEKQIFNKKSLCDASSNVYEIFTDTKSYKLNKTRISGLIPNFYGMTLSRKASLIEPRILKLYILRDRFNYYLNGEQMSKSEFLAKMRAIIQAYENDEV